MLSAIEEFTAARAIEQLMACRLRAMDTKDWALYRSLHAADIVMESFANFPDRARPPGVAADGRVVGREQVTDVIRVLMEEPVPMTSVHQVFSKEISFPTATTAIGIWAMADQLWWQNGPVEEHLRGCGHYHEEYRREDDRWRISRRRLARLRVQATPNFYDKVGAAVDRLD